MSDYPKDWEAVELGEYNLITSSKRVFEKEWENRGVPFFRTRDIVSFHSKEEQNDKLFISEETYQNKVTVSGAPHKGDLLVTGVGSIGIPFLIENDNKIYFKDGNIIWIKKGDFFHPKYLYYLFLSSKIKNQILNYSGFTTVGTLTIKNAKKLRIPKISLKEQKAIADTLMTFDKHIENLEKLIKKKKMVRDGAVEDLMTGKTRLDGFGGEWENIKLEEILGYTQPSDFIENKIEKKGKIPVLTAGKSFILGYSNDESRVYRNLPTILFDDFTTDVRYITFPFKVKSSATKFLGLKTKNYSIKYIYYWLKNLNYIVQSHERHWISLFSKLDITVPSLKEQEAIASILTSMDDEIENLEKEKAKIEKIKAGAMDDLLTGRVRLI